MKYRLNSRIAAYDKKTKKYFICEDIGNSGVENGFQASEPKDKQILYYFETFARLRENSFDLAIENIKLLIGKKKIYVLDIGCSYGLFLKKVHEQGWDGVGIEPNEQEVRFVQERFHIEVAQTTIEDFVSDKKWDIITFWDVLEHLPDPFHVLQKVKSMLNGDGILIIRVPNGRGLIHRLSFIAYRVSLGFFNFPLKKLFENHLYIYTESSLNEMLRKAGFETILSYSEYMIDPHVHAIRRKSYLIQFPEPLKSLVSSMLVILLRLSGVLSMKDALVVYCRKTQ
jgi:2-polyprenyl-3-methyl-5-hydroxy-6-metoxy-1,4-benzoquinol methylase